MANQQPHPQPRNPGRSAPEAIVMAAGKGTRMKSSLPKVMHPVGGRPMVALVVDACLAAGCRRVIAVVGYQQELVREALSDYGDKVAFAVQAEQLGTGHAVGFTEPLLSGPDAPSDVFVLAGDGPLIRPQTLAKVLDRHRQTGAAATLATSVIDDATGYGRIVRDSAGNFVSIVEHKNCTPGQLAIREVNPSYYCFQTRALFEALAGLRPNTATGEYYITDVPARLMAAGRRVEVIEAVPPEDVLSINTPEELARVDAIYRARSASPLSAGACR
jgi:bifunctional UDP-N-acetylglucosamine pyrophosphorylase/glucosamine-1-phosphate N-acetyltransferase